jgi:hypothetical protein
MAAVAAAHLVVAVVVAAHPTAAVAVVNLTVVAADTTKRVGLQ